MTCSVRSRSKLRLPGRFFGWIFLLAGLLLLGLVLFRDARLALFGVRGEGVVEHVKVTHTSSHQASNGKPGKRSPSYTLTVAHQPPGALEPVRFKTNSTYGHVHELGHVVPLVYFPAKPSSAQINTARQLWLPLMTGAVFSILLLGLGWFILARSRQLKVLHEDALTV